MNKKINFALIGFSVVMLIGFVYQVTRCIEAFGMIRQDHRSPKLDIIDPATMAAQKANCVTSSVAGLTFPICTYTAMEDVVVSARTQSGQYWEKEMVVKMIEILRKIPSAMFIDIGTNIGAYSLPAAHLGRQVVSLEPTIQTMRHLATSVHRGNISSRIILLYNAVSNERTMTHMHIRDPVNFGANGILPSMSCVNNSNNSECLTPAVRTIHLDDLLSLIHVYPYTNRKVVMKVDAEGSELKIFDPLTSAEFFSRLDVLIMQVEWEVIKRFNTNAESRRQCETVLDHLYRQHFIVYPKLSIRSAPLNRSLWLQWPGDVFFVNTKYQHQL